MVKTQTESHIRALWKIWVFYSFEVRKGTYVTHAFGDSPKLSSGGLAVPRLIRCSEFITPKRVSVTFEGMVPPPNKRSDSLVHLVAALASRQAESGGQGLACTKALHFTIHCYTVICNREIIIFFFF